MWRARERLARHAQERPIFEEIILAETGNLAGENPNVGTARTLDTAAFVFLLVFALVQPLSISAAEAAFAISAVCWLVRIAFVGRKALIGSPLDAFILVYWLLCGISTLFAPLPASSWEGMRKIALIFLVLVVIHNVLDTRRTRNLLAVLFLGGLVSVAYAGWQLAFGVGLRVVTCDPGGLAYNAGIRAGSVILSVGGHGVRSPEGFLAILTDTDREATDIVVDPNAAASQLIVAKDAVSVILPARLSSLPPTFESLGLTLVLARPPRARGFYSHFITYSDEMAMLLALAFGLWLAAPRRWAFPGLWFAAMAIVFALALGATLSLSAMLAAALGCAVQVWFRVRLTWLRALLPLAFVLAVLAANAALQHARGAGLIDPRDPGTQYRLLMWRDAGRLIRQHPLVGVGMNTIRDAWPRFDLAAYRLLGLRSHFHSAPVQIAVELGIPVLLAWLALMAAHWLGLARLIGRARERGDPLLYGLCLGMLGATTGFLANSLVQYNFGDSVIVLLFWFLVGLAQATRRQLAE